MSYKVEFIMNAVILFLILLSSYIFDLLFIATFAVNHFCLKFECKTINISFLSLLLVIVFVLGIDGYGKFQNYCHVRNF